MRKFLNELSDEQLSSLQHILVEEIEGDLDFFLFKVEEELHIRKKNNLTW